MGKRYIRKRGSLARGTIHKFICTKCLQEFVRKDKIKQHLEKCKNIL